MIAAAAISGAPISHAQPMSFAVRASHSGAIGRLGAIPKA
jgi:hypothetical protein